LLILVELIINFLSRHKLDTVLPLLQETHLLSVGGSITASTALAQGILYDGTLVAAANNDVLVGLDINPTFTNGAFTGVENVGLRIGNAGFVIGSGYGYGALYGYANDGIIQVKTAASYNTQLWFRPAGNAGGYNSSYWSRIENDGGNFKVIAGNYGTLGLYTNNAGSSGANIILTGVIGAANNSLTINGAGNAGRIALTTFGSSPITLNGGNVLIGTTTDAGYKLDVNGTGRFSGNLEVNAGNNGQIFINNVYPRLLFGKTGTPSWSIGADTENSGQFEIGTGAGFPYNTFTSRIHISSAE